VKRPPRLACAAVLAVALGACAVGPEYKPPAPPAHATAPLVAPSSSVASPDEAPDAWWKLYEDTTLDALIKEAFAANTDLRIAEANLAGARAIYLAARSARLPQTNVAAGVDYGRNAVTDEILELTGRRPVTLWVYDALLDVNYEIDLFGHVRRSIEAAGAGAEASEAQRNAVRVTVAAETARAYAQLCALGEQLAVARHSLELVSRESEITAQRRAAGAGSEFDEVRAEALVEQVRATIPPLEGQRRAAQFELAALLGRTPADLPTGLDACAKPPQLKTLLPAGDGAALLRRRPDIRAADRRLAAAVAQIGVATADLYPRFSLGALYGSIASPWPKLDTVNGQTWAISPSIDWTFPIQTGLRARVMQAKAGAAAALAYFDSVVLTALKETAQALSTYTAEADHHAALSAAEAKARRAFELAHTQFVAGAVSNLDLLTSEQALVAADAAVAVSDMAMVQDQVAVFKALGGGWRTDDLSRQPAGSSTRFEPTTQSREQAAVRRDRP
jgi:NodT family efflux transporter outer membrane factor (OMF) lipoprotein